MTVSPELWITLLIAGWCAWGAMTLFGSRPLLRARQDDVAEDAEIVLAHRTGVRKR